jgi:hypothetical protein
MADVRKNKCAGCTTDCKRRDITVGNLSSGQAPNAVQIMARNQERKTVTVKDKVNLHADIDPRFNNRPYYTHKIAIFASIHPWEIGGNIHIIYESKSNRSFRLAV